MKLPNSIAIIFFFINRKKKTQENKTHYVLYSDSNCRFMVALNEYKVLHDFVESGRAFHMSGLWCLNGFCAIINLGFLR